MILHTTGISDHRANLHLSPREGVLRAQPSLPQHSHGITPVRNGTVQKEPVEVTIKAFIKPPTCSVIFGAVPNTTIIVVLIRCAEILLVVLRKTIACKTRSVIVYNLLCIGRLPHFPVNA